VTFAVKQEAHTTSVGMETQQLVFVYTVELRGTVRSMKCAKFLI